MSIEEIVSSSISTYCTVSNVVLLKYHYVMHKQKYVCVLDPGLRLALALAL